MVVHAATHYGVRVIGVTLSRQQAEYGQKHIAELGLSDVAEIRHDDYRNVAETGFDAISSIGLTEHIGAKNLPCYARFLADQTAAAGPPAQPLHHPAGDDSAPARAGGFINRYVFPDGELEAVGTIVSVLQDNGLEVRHEENFREHYARTCAAWGRTWMPTGTRRSPRSARDGPGCGGCTWPRRASASRSGASNCTRCWRCGPRTASRGCRSSGSATAGRRGLGLAWRSRRPRPAGSSCLYRSRVSVSGLGAFAVSVR